MNTNLSASSASSASSAATIESLPPAAEASPPVALGHTDTWGVPIELSEAQIRSMKLTAVLADAIKFYIELRLAARERSLYLKDSVAYLIQLQIEEMLKSAIFELCGELAEGAASIGSGAMQVYSATRTLNELKTQADKIQPSMKAESDALEKVQAAKQRVAELQTQGKSDASPEMQEAQATLKNAEAGHAVKRKELQEAWKAGLESCELKSVEAQGHLIHGGAAILKGLGDILKGTMKYESAQYDAAQKLYDALKRAVEGTQQYVEDFERELKGLVDQSLDTIKTIVDRAFQTATSLIKK